MESNHYHLKEHSSLCSCSKHNRPKTLEEIKNDTSGYSIYKLLCEKNPEAFLFYSEQEFHFVTYFKCLECGDHLDFKERLLNSFTEKRKLYGSKITRAYDLERNLKEHRLRGVNLKTHITEINHLYGDASHKTYCYARDIDYYSMEIDNEKVEESYNATKEYLNSNGYSHLVSELDRLKQVNTFRELDPNELLKSTKHLIKLINKKNKQHETSKRKESISPLV